ncbi:NUDIX domain-containing protein [Cellulomonas sp. NPDC089187]|uniref:NUDIX hydrolase n=1 Tax=Cellulomonas sp. NPDC089187 TaxID=3154970 RepID=UPI00342BC781
MTERYAPDDHIDGRSLLVAASYLLVLDRGRLLLQLREGTGYRDGHWATLAGHVDPGESAHQAAIREAREEAGIIVDPADLEPLTALHRFQPGGPQVEQRIDLFFLTRRFTGEPARREPEKAAAMDWFDLDDLPTPLVPHEAAVIAAWRAGRLAAVWSMPS